MNLYHIFYFPFYIGTENEEVQPLFSEEFVQGMANRDFTYRINIIGCKDPNPSILKINQMLSFMEYLLEEEIEWQFVGINQYRKDKILIVSLHTI